jgi:uncharacterized protein (DUF1778 family)
MKRDEILSVRVRPIERQKLELAASLTGESASSSIRERALRCAAHAIRTNLHKNGDEDGEE